MCSFGVILIIKLRFFCFPKMVVTHIISILLADIFTCVAFEVGHAIGRATPCTVDTVFA